MSQRVIDDRDPAITYPQGDWTAYTATSASELAAGWYQNTWHYCNGGECEAWISFHGSGVEVKADESGWHGRYFCSLLTRPRGSTQSTSWTNRGTGWWDGASSTFAVNRTLCALSGLSEDQDEERCLVVGTDEDDELYLDIDSVVLTTGGGTRPTTQTLQWTSYFPISPPPSDYSSASTTRGTATGSPTSTPSVTGTQAAKSSNTALTAGVSVAVAVVVIAALIAGVWFFRRRRRYGGSGGKGGKHHPLVSGGEYGSQASSPFVGYGGHGYGSEWDDGEEHLGGGDGEKYSSPRPYGAGDYGAYDPMPARTPATTIETSSVISSTPGIPASTSTHDSDSFAPTFAVPPRMQQAQTQEPAWQPGPPYADGRPYQLSLVREETDSEAAAAGTSTEEGDARFYRSAGSTEGLGGRATQPQVAAEPQAAPPTTAAIGLDGRRRSKVPDTTGLEDPDSFAPRG